MPTPSRKKSATRARLQRPRKDNGLRAKVAPRFRPGMKHTILTDYRFERGILASDIAKSAGVIVGVVNRLERGASKGHKGKKVAANHPALPALAKAYGVTVDALAPFLGPAIDYWTNRATPDTIAPGKRLALAKPAPTVTAKIIKAKHTKRGYNKLTRVPLSVREFARGLVTEVNVRAMEGASEIILPPMPLAIVRDFLGDYLTAKGINAHLLVDPNFAKAFG